jgi:hypothetical protein
MAQAMVDAGALTSEAAEHSRLKHVLWSALGGKEALPEVISLDCEWEDVMLLCSDGLTKHVTDEEIQEYLPVTWPGDLRDLITKTSNERERQYLRCRRLAPEALNGPRHRHALLPFRHPAGGTPRRPARSATVLRLGASIRWFCQTRRFRDGPA